MPNSKKRSQKQAPKYKDSDDSESGEDFVDSGSEASIPEDEEVENDSADSSGEEFTEEVAKNQTKVTPKLLRKSTASKIQAKSRISMETIKRNLQSAGEKNSLEEQSPEDREEHFSVKDLTDKEKLLPSFLNLSESDTDDSEDESLNKRSSPVQYKQFVQKSQAETVKIKKEKEDSIKKFNKESGRLSDSETDAEMEDVNPDVGETFPIEEATSSKRLNFQHLQEHAQKLAEAKQSLELYNKRHSAKRLNKEVFNIKELLAMGETETLEERIPSEQDTSDSDVEDLEEVKGEAKSILPKGGIQLVLHLPTDRPNTKNKQLDLEMMMKRRMNRIKKQYQVFTHKVHVLCWLGHGNFVNKTLNDQSVMAAALSLIPSEHCYPSDRIDIKYVEQITRWYNGAMNLKEDKNELKYKPNKRPLNLALLQQIDKKTVISKKNLYFIFVSMLRALGVKCRIVFSFRVVPLRPPETELCSLKTKNKEPEKGNSKGETSKHFKNSSTDKTNNKNIDNHPKPATVAKTNQCSKVKSKKTAKKIKNASDEKISQLDGADDRDLPKSQSHSSHKQNSNKPLALNKKNISNQSKNDTPSPKIAGTSNMSYWDQIMQKTAVQEATVEKRISHKNLRLLTSPQTSPKTKIKEEIPSVFNESTLSVGNPPYVKSEKFDIPDVKMKEEILSFAKALGNFLPNAASSSKSSSLKKASTNQSDTNHSQSPKGHTSKVPQKINTGTRISNRLKQTEQVSSSKSLERLTEEKNLAPEKLSRGKQSKSPLSECEMATRAKKPRVVKKPVLSKSKESAEHIKLDNKQENEILPKSKPARNFSSQSENGEKASTAVVKKSTPASDENILIAKTRRKTVIPNEKAKLKENMISTESTSKISHKKQGKEIPQSQTKVSQRKGKSLAPSEVSIYFDSADSTSKKTQSKSAGERVSHRDLLNKSLPSSGSTNSKRRTIDVTKDIVALVKDRIRETKAQARSKLIKGKIRDSSDEDSDYVEVEVANKGRTRKESHNSDADFKPSKKRASNMRTIKDRRVLSTDDDQSTEGTKKRGADVWCEVYVEEEEQWISVDILKAQVHCSREIYSRASHPVTYIVGWDTNGYVKDVTRRYVPHWNTTTRKLRTDPVWYEVALRPFSAPRSLREIQEDKQLDRLQMDAPLPPSIMEYKNHPLYALKRHLLKFEVIYPPDAMTLGFVKKEAVYARECVHVCRSRETWVKEAKVVKPGEEPYKIVKARPKYDRSSGTLIKDIPLEIFGPWQVADYVPPQAENGKVPRNPYGNVELFKACMLPKGTVHIPLPGLNKVARKLNIDCAPAMTGFDYHSGWSHPVYDGFVVCEEFREQLVEAWEQEQEEAEQRAREKIEKRVYGNWRRIIRGLYIRERLKARYDFQSELQEISHMGGSKAKKRSKAPRFVAKKRRSCDGSSGTDSS